MAAANACALLEPEEEACAQACARAEASPEAKALAYAEADADCSRRPAEGVCTAGKQSDDHKYLSAKVPPNV